MPRCFLIAAMLQNWTGEFAKDHVLHLPIHPDGLSAKKSQEHP